MLLWVWAGHVSVKQDSTTSTRSPIDVVRISSSLKRRRDNFPHVETLCPSVLDSLSPLSARPSAQSSTSRSCTIFGDSTLLDSVTRSNAATTRERAIAADQSGPFRLETESLPVRQRTCSFAYVSAQPTTAVSIRFSQLCGQTVRQNWCRFVCRFSAQSLEHRLLPPTPTIMRPMHKTFGASTNT